MEKTGDCGANYDQRRSSVLGMLLRVVLVSIPK